MDRFAPDWWLRHYALIVKGGLIPSRSTRATTVKKEWMNKSDTNCLNYTWKETKTAEKGSDLSN
jgi:hypothetical protein